MTKSKPSPVPKTYDVSFVNCELDKSTKEQVKGWDPKLELTWDHIDDLMNEGYKISISTDKHHDCVGVYCTMPNPDHKHHGMCLTARGPNWLQAVKVLVFKHYQILDGDWGTVVDQKSTRDEWG